MAVVQVRALLYVGALSNGILEALANLERALTDAIITPVRLMHPPPPKPQPRHMYGLRLPLVLGERLSMLAMRLPRRNSPLIEGSEEGSSRRASSTAAEEEAGREVRALPCLP